MRVQRAVDSWVSSGTDLLINFRRPEGAFDEEGRRSSGSLLWEWVSEWVNQGAAKDLMTSDRIWLRFTDSLNAHLLCSDLNQCGNAWCAYGGIGLLLSELENHWAAESVIIDT
jgi:hypothetical protein